MSDADGNKINALWLKWQPIETEENIFAGDS